MSAMTDREDAYVAELLKTRDALAAIIEDVLPSAKVQRRWVFDEDTDRWAAELLSDKDLNEDESYRIYAVQVYFDGLSKAPGAVRTLTGVVPFGVGFFREYELGTDDDNAEQRLIEDIARVQMRLETLSDLEVGELYPEVSMHSGLDVPRINYLPLGRRNALTANGRIEVTMNPRFVR